MAGRVKELQMIASVVQRWETRQANDISLRKRSCRRRMTNHYIPIRQEDERFLKPYGVACISKFPILNIEGNICAIVEFNELRLGHPDDRRRIGEYFRNDHI